MLQSIRTGKNTSPMPDDADDQEQIDDDIRMLRLPEIMPDNTRDVTGFLRRYDPVACAYVRSHDIRELLVIAQIRDHSFDIEDLDQEARIGVFIALCKYDVSKGATFETYAYYWIRQRVMRFLLNRGLVRTPGQVKRMVASHRRVVERWKEDVRTGRTELGLEETVSEWIHTNNISVQLLISGLIVHTMRFVDFSEPIKKRRAEGRTGIVFGDVIRDDTLMVHDQLLSSEDALETCSLVQTILGYAMLTEGEKELLLRRYGLQGNPAGATLDELGLRWGVSGEMIRKRLNRIMDKLRLAYTDICDEEDEVV